MGDSDRTTSARIVALHCVACYPSPVLDETRITYADEPALTPDGVETIARCSVCGAPYVPKHSKHTSCSPRCSATAKQRTEAARARVERGYVRNASYRLARRAWRRLGVDPATVAALDALRGRGAVDGWRALVGLPPEHRGRTPEEVATAPTTLNAPRCPWRATVGPQPSHLRAAGMELHFSPRLSARGRDAEESVRRHLHGMLSLLVARAHDRNTPAWSLVPMRGEAWGVVLYDPADVERLRGTSHAVTVGACRTTLTIGPAVVRLRAPATLTPRRYTVILDAVTPVVQSTMGRTRAVTQPTATTVLGAVSLALQVAGVAPRGRIHVESVACETMPERVRLGGHLGASGCIVGWVGRLTITCNAPAAWALLVAAQVGYGGKCAYGLGRVRVEVTK